MPTTLTCRICGGLYPLADGAELQACPACGTLNSRPQAAGPVGEMLRRATRQRLDCDFHNAVNSYQHVLLDYPEEHEALWGLALCRYGVEYVDDPKTGRRMPVVHSIRKKPMQTDGDFLQACELAPLEVAAQYEAEAVYIDDAMHKIRQLAEACPPYDVFICHKTTQPGSEAYTEDYARAFKLYHMLEKQGYRAFFAPMEMEGVAAGSDYEAAIYHALDTAKVMLVVCSDAEYLASAWVRSEWMRFLEMADERGDKCLLPLLYGGMTPAKLPRDFRARKLQAIMMGEMGSAEAVVGTVRKYAGRARGTMPETAAPAPVPEESAPPMEASACAPESDFETEPVKDGCRITRYVGRSREVRIPPEIGGRRVTQIGAEAFRANLLMESAVLPDGVTDIAYAAFRECTNLRQISLPESLTGIGSNAFQSCRLLQEIRLPRGITAIADRTFNGCSSLTEVVIPERVVSLGEAAFDFCEKLRAVTLPAGLREIGSQAFYRCYELSSINLPDQVKLGRDVFGQCKKLPSFITRRSSTGFVGFFDKILPF